MTSISVDDHRERIVAGIRPLEPTTVPLADALGLTLVSPVIARVDYPGFDNSAMDGYALRHADAATATPGSPIALDIIADLPAGTRDNPRLMAGHAARIMTGAPIPGDADTIVPVEDTDRGERTVLIYRAPLRSAHIRRTGNDFETGEPLLPAGRRLHARDLAVAATAGAPDVQVRPAPRIGVITTGSELRPPGVALERGETHDSNSVLITATVTANGGIPVPLGRVPDDEDALHAVFATHASRVDAFVTSGGVSVGAYDIVRTLLAPLGVWFGAVRMQPGKPQGFGHWPATGSGAGSSVPILALPGNPVSAFVSCQEFLAPAVLALQGRGFDRQLVRAHVEQAWTSAPGKRQFLPVVIDRDAFTVRPAGDAKSGTHRVAALAEANAIAVVDEAVTNVGVGDTCECYYI